MSNARAIRFSDIHSIHFVGIKGIAMTALAVWAHEKGIRISGSDIREQFPSEPILKKIKAKINIGFDTAHIGNPDLVIYTGAHEGRENIEVTEAGKRGIPVLPHGKALGIAMKGKHQISVAGSHGKTTTSAMIATILTYAGMDPSYAIGCGEIRGLGLPGHSGHGEYFVAEADEYVTDPTHDQTPRFLWQTPDILVVTNVDYDHPDAYPTLASVQEAFERLMDQQEGEKTAILNHDDPASTPLFARKQSSDIQTYGLSENAMFRASDIVFHTGKTTFMLTAGNKRIGLFTLKVPGSHNILNALSAIAASRKCGVAWDTIENGLEKFEGAKRRFESLGERKGISFFDDYAHHPKEISATLSAVRSWYPKHRLIVVFQPHTYSRTKSLLPQFGTCFTSCDIVIGCEIYGSARETDTLGMNGKRFIEEVQKHHRHVLFAPYKSDVIDVLRQTAKKDDIVIFMGAGDIYSWEKEVTESL